MKQYIYLEAPQGLVPIEKATREQLNSILPRVVKDAAGNILRRITSEDLEALNKRAFGHDKNNSQRNNRR